MTKPTMKTYNDGSREWCFPNGERHREDGPAYISGNHQKWYQHGKLHREGGPAVIDGNINFQSWWLHGERHREDGPAVIDGNRKEYWLNGKQIDDLFRYWYLNGKNNLEKD